MSLLTALLGGVTELRNGLTHLHMSWNWCSHSILEEWFELPLSVPLVIGLSLSQSLSALLRLICWSDVSIPLHLLLNQCWNTILSLQRLPHAILLHHYGRISLLLWTAWSRSSCWTEEGRCLNQKPVPNVQRGITLLLFLYLPLRDLRNWRM